MYHESFYRLFCYWTKTGYSHNVINQYFPEAYTEGEDLKNPMISPFFADDSLLKRLPPLLFASGTKDTLKTEDIAFYERALHCGCKAALYIAEGMPHGYVEAYYQICEAREAGIEDHFPSDLGFDQLLKDGSLLRTQNTGPLILETA